MPSKPVKPAQQIDELVTLFDALPVESQAEFAIRRCVAMSQAIAKAHGPLTDPRAKPLQILHGESGHIICTLDGRRISNGDVLEIPQGVPDTWLRVWIEDLPHCITACLLTPYEVSRIELNERSYLRWPRQEDRALNRQVMRRQQEIEEARRQA